jgi:hypothetical protein
MILANAIDLPEARVVGPLEGGIAMKTRAQERGSMFFDNSN